MPVRRKNHYLFHWEEGAPCQVCGTPLAKIRTGSTGSYLCPGCRRLEPPDPPTWLKADSLHVSA